MDKELLEAYSATVGSKIKIAIILALNQKILTPKKIAQNVNKRINHISTYLAQLKTGNIVICLNEEKKKGRLYKLTELGFNVFKELKKNEMI